MGLVLKILQLDEGEGAVGKLLLTVRGPADQPVEIDPGLAILQQRDDAGKVDYFLSLEERVAVSVLGRLHGENAPEYRAVPLGLEPDAVVKLITRPGRGGVVVQKSWEEANEALDRWERGRQ